jgi:alpha-beta hydrolase superfamily lysophospholipase/SAM-dependent methyltransferase
MVSPVVSECSGATRVATEHYATTWDGQKLFYRAWQPVVPGNRALLLFHRGHEHSERFQELVEQLDLKDVWIFAWDARGHGRSSGERGYAENFSCLVKDVDAFVESISREYGIPVENIVVMAHSVGSVSVAAWVHDYAPPIRAMVLACPAFRVRLYIPFALPLLRFRQWLTGRAFVQSYVKARRLTHDPVQAEQYKTDPLITRAIAVNILVDLHDTSTRLLADARAIRVPTLVLAAGTDWVVKLSAQTRFFERLSSPVKEMRVYPGFYHDLFHETDRHLPIAKARGFIRTAFEHPPLRPWVNRGGGAGVAEAGIDPISKRAMHLAARHLFYPWLQLLMKSVGRLSRGVRIGWRRGFDSGESLDYVYQNMPRGITPVGKMLDRLYLNTIGWKAIRRRKANLQRVLQATIEEASLAGKPVRVLDIASGPARYVLETLRRLPHIPVSALLRDNDSNNVEAGRRLARQMGVNSVTYTQGDAFDRKSLAAITPAPTIAIVSGLYELFADNQVIVTSLRGIAEALMPGGYLIYTNQPWHPQLDLIARVLTNREGRPWVMRCRPQAEMDALVREAGFEKVLTRIDEFGIFSVSVARKLPGTLL